MSTHRERDPNKPRKSKSHNRSSKQRDENGHKIKRTSKLKSTSTKNPATALDPAPSFGLPDPHASIPGTRSPSPSLFLPQDTTPPSSPPPPSKKHRRTTKTKEPDTRPIWERNVTSQYQRNRKRYKLSRNSLDTEVREEDIAALASTLYGDSTLSFGEANSSRLIALTQKKRKARGGLFSLRALLQGKLGLNETQAVEPEKEKPQENRPEHSHILRLALEDREVIYSYLLTYPKSIMVKHDWLTLERNPHRDHNIMLVCRQFGIEATAFLYRYNKFQALIRNTTHQVRILDAPPVLPSMFLGSLHNLIINFAPDCWGVRWSEKTAMGLRSLVEAGAVIKSLTLVFTMLSPPAPDSDLGEEWECVLFSDFLGYEGELITAIRLLAPQVIIIKIKKGATKGFGMEVDMRYLNAGKLKLGPLANPETIRIRDEKVEETERQLRILKEMYEAIYEGDEAAVAAGKRISLVGDRSVLERIGHNTPAPLRYQLRNRDVVVVRSNPFA